MIGLAQKTVYRALRVGEIVLSDLFSLVIYRFFNPSPAIYHTYCSNDDCTDDDDQEEIGVPCHFCDAF